MHKGRYVAHENSLRKQDLKACGPHTGARSIGTIRAGPEAVEVHGNRIKGASSIEK